MERKKYCKAYLANIILVMLSFWILFLYNSYVSAEGVVDDLWPNVSAIEGQTYFKSQLKTDGSWPVNTGWPIHSSPVVADLENDGELEILFPGSWNPVFYCFDKTGQTKWTHPLTGGTSTVPTVADINNDGFKEILTADSGGSSNPYAGYLRCLDKDGNQLWEYATSSWIYSSPVVADINNDGDIEIIVPTYYGTIYCFDINGNVLWTKYITDGYINSSAAIYDIDKDGYAEMLIGDMYRDATPRKLFCLDHNGDTQWEYQIDGDANRPPVIADLDNDGEIEIVTGSSTIDPLAHTYDNKLYCLDSLGVLKWTFEIAENTGIISSASAADLDNNGSLELIFGARDNKIYCIDKDGNKMWEFYTGSVVADSPAIADLDQDGDLEVLISSNDTNFYCLDKDGKEIWRRTTGDKIYGAPAMADLDQDGDLEVLFTTNHEDSFPYDGKLYCLDKDGNDFVPQEGSPENYVSAPWPTFKHDFARTGLYQAIEHIPATIFVPVDYPTIQQAIDAAVSGDTVQVSAGTYVENIILKKGVNLIGEGAGKSIIIAATEGNTIYCADNCIIEGFTIKNDFSSGGAVLCEYSSPIIRNNIICNAISLWYSYATIEDNEIYSNGDTGLINSAHSSPTIIGNELYSLKDLSTFLISIYEYFQDDKTKKIIISNNRIDGQLDLHAITQGPETIIEDNIIVPNGDMNTESNTFRIFGVSFEPYRCVVKNNTIFGISADDAVQLNYAANIDFINNIFYGVSVGDYFDVNLSYNDIYGRYYDNFPDQTGINGNIAKDPLFVDSENRDFHLKLASPCIDAGDPSSDYSNEPEPNGDRINMGAYGNTQEAEVSFGFDPNLDGQTIDVVLGVDSFPISASSINEYFNKKVLSVNAISAKAQYTEIIEVENAPSWLRAEITPADIAKEKLANVSFYINRAIKPSFTPLKPTQTVRIKAYCADNTLGEISMDITFRVVKKQQEKQGSSIVPVYSTLKTR